MILCGDALQQLRALPAESVHCVVTSPPYWRLRDYGVTGQLGLERSLADYLAAMLDVFAEVHRVLRPDGTCWVNMGDKYAGGGSPGQGRTGQRADRAAAPGRNFVASGEGLAAPGDPGRYERKGLLPGLRHALASDERPGLGTGLRLRAAAHALHSDGPVQRDGHYGRGGGAGVRVQLHRDRAESRMVQAVERADLRAAVRGSGNGAGQMLLNFRREFTPDLKEESCISTI